MGEGREQGKKRSLTGEPQKPPNHHAKLTRAIFYLAGRIGQAHKLGEALGRLHVGHFQAFLAPPPLDKTFALVFHTHALAAVPLVQNVILCDCRCADALQRHLRW